MPSLPDFLVLLGLTFVSVLIGFAVHEYSHARMAYALGDPKAKYEGRMTLNPIVHVDPVGALVLMVTLLASKGSLVVGWGKPVVFDPDNLKDPVTGGAAIALAGPAANFVLAALAGAPLHFGFPPEGIGRDAVWILAAVNVALGLFNLIPFPPLDGWKIAQVFVPRSTAWSMKRFEQRMNMAWFFGFMAVVWLLGPYVLGPPYRALMLVFTGSGSL